jgi:hypothetical protein
MSTDWVRVRDQMERECGRLARPLPDGFRLSLACHADPHGSAYTAGLYHAQVAELHGHGQARTPAEALKAAAADWQRKLEALPRDRQLAAAKAAGLPVPAAGRLQGRQLALV